MPSPDPLAAARTGGLRVGHLRVGLGAAVVLLIVGAAVAVLVSALNASAGNRTVVGQASPAPSATPSAGVGGLPNSAATIYVHILGAVARPGLYQFRDGDRAVDAISAAGGFTDDADQKQLNLARFLSDGEQIYVPTEEEVASGVGSIPGAPAGSSTGKVNLNTADSAALETLPRVGPSLAARIIAWREANGRFTSIEDLMSVSGIGDKTFAGLKDLVTI
jgi:competence protein ComEA